MEGTYKVQLLDAGPNSPFGNGMMVYKENSPFAWIKVPSGSGELKEGLPGFLKNSFKLPEKPVMSVLKPFGHFGKELAWETKPFNFRCGLGLVYSLIDYATRNKLKPSDPIYLNASP
ncbi:MAG: hypothetical protein JW727_06370 [Candidatus Aenigmarchaeota archaeon]|nr:hypothetical protein [Candidatus Aenigmarchaeota archaeon]